MLNECFDFVLSYVCVLQNPHFLLSCCIIVEIGVARVLLLVCMSVDAGVVTQQSLGLRAVTRSHAADRHR